MKKGWVGRWWWLSILLVMAGLPVSGDCAERAMMSTLDRVHRTAARRFLAEALEDIKTEFARAGVREQDPMRELAKEMLDPAKFSAHKTPDGSRETAATWFGTKLDAEWDARSELVRTQFSLGSEEYQALREETGAKFSRTREVLLDTQIRGDRAPLFAAAREAAVRQQRASLSHDAYPPFETVDTSVDRAGWDQKVRPSVERLVSAGQRLLEENQASMGEITEAIRRDVEAQRMSQVSRVEQSQSGVLPELVVKDGIAAFLKDAVDRGLEKDRQASEGLKDGRVVYRRFKTTDAEVDTQALAMERDRFGEFLKTFKPKVPEAEALAQEISRDPAGHKTLEGSKQVFVSRLQAEAIPQAIEQYRQHVPPGLTDREARDFAERLQRAAKGDDPGVTAALKAVLDGQLDPVLEIARKRVADAQLVKYFSLPGKTEWTIGEATLDSVVRLEEKKELGFADYRDLFGTARGSGGSAPVLDEVEREVVAKGREALGRGREAWQVQSSLVESIGVRVEEEVRAAKPAQDPGKKHWIKQYTTMVETSWAKEAGYRRYPELFGAMRKRIEERVSVFYEAMVKNSGTRGGSGGGNGPGKGPGGGGGGGGGGNCSCPPPSDEALLRLVRERRLDSSLTRPPDGGFR
jgi:hypothetical protein